MLQLHNRRAAALAAALAVLGSLTTAAGAFSEDALPDPIAATRNPAAEESPAGDENPAVAKSAADGPAVAESTTAERTRSEPVGLDIAGIGVHTAVTPIGLRDDGTLDVPELRSDAPAAWYQGSPAPGEDGASVIVGHVDTASDGPAVFYRLRELVPGDTVAVRRADGSTVHFAVTRVASYPKARFPTAEVYAATASPEIRLITCGGAFDRAAGHYRSNIVVYASAVR
ncbi:class F sortase [Actinoplanes sp. NPDC051851]|uniref:class F sortase n=1 Tax=Actinoplanes sp. NPDC051851 TaxID=3154753 RepID=UPI00341340A2